MSHRVLAYDFQTTERHPLQIRSDTISLASWHRRLLPPNTVCYPMQWWIFKSNICEFYLTWTSGGKYGTLKCKLYAGVLAGALQDRKFSRSIFRGFYLKQKYSPVHSTRQNSTRAHRNYSDTQWWDHPCGVPCEGWNRDGTLHHLPQHPHKNPHTIWMAKLNSLFCPTELALQITPYKYMQSWVWLSVLKQNLSH